MEITDGKIIFVEEVHCKKDLIVYGSTITINTVVQEVYTVNNIDIRTLRYWSRVKLLLYSILKVKFKNG